MGESIAPGKGSGDHSLERELAQHPRVQHADVISGLTLLIRKNAQLQTHRSTHHSARETDLAEFAEIVAQMQPILVAAVRLLEEQSAWEQNRSYQLAMCSVCQRHQPAGQFDLAGERLEFETCFWGKTPVCDACLPAYREQLQAQRLKERAIARIPRAREIILKRLTEKVNIWYPERRDQVIYKLTDPETGEIRYIGLTHDLHMRVRNHMHMPADKVTEAKRLWIDNLRLKQLSPIATVIEQVDPPEMARAREFRWILHYLKQSAPLTNVEASYTHLVQICQSAPVESFLTEPLESPIWEGIIEAFAFDMQEQWGTNSKGRWRQR